MIDGRAIAEGIFAAIVGAFIAGIAVGVMVTVGLPWLWQMVKPLIHAWTA
jgi:hypothetical protein